MVKKGLLEKGKVRSKQRFKLLHRPVTEKIKKMYKGAKDFVRRIATENILKPVSEVQKFKSNPVGEQKRNPPREELKSYIYRREGEDLWERIAPTCRS